MARYLLAWLPMVFIAAGNGALREAWLTPRLGELQGRQLSTVLLIVLLAAYIWGVTKILTIRNRREAVTIGAAWLALTLAFEFALGRFLSGLSWSEMLAEYDLTAGRLWPLVPLWVAIAPYLFYRIRA
jgi:uncharacterized membrane protein (DUF4010 family)